MDSDDFDPKLEPYQSLERLGFLHTFTAREAAILVGYAVIIVSPSHLHYPNKKFAMQDVMYVDSRHRGAMPFRFVLYQDAHLRDLGVNIVYRHNTFHKDYSRLLVRLGYRAEEVRYIKEIG